VQVVGDHAFVADGEAGLRILDLSDLEAVHEVGQYTPPKADIRAVTVVGPYAYVAAGARGLVVLDIRNPLIPREVGRFDTPQAVRSVKVAGSHVYIGDSGWLRVADISAPTAPKEIAAAKMPSHAEDLWVSNGVAYVAAYDAGLLLLELSPAAAHATASVR
jgi:hypothetical protein